MRSISMSSYQALSLGIGLAGGLAAGAVFDQVWKQVAGAEEAPDPKDLDTSMRDVFAAAALQGLVVGVVRAAMKRATAHGYHAVADTSLD